MAGLLAAGLLVWQGSYAAFTATSTNQADSWATGKLVLTNNGTGGSTFTATTSTPLINATNLVPGASTFTRCITVESSGTLTGTTLKFYRGGLTDVPSATAPTFPLSAAITVKVDAAALAATDLVDPTCSATGSNVAFPAIFSGIQPTTALSGLPTSAAGAAATMPVATAGVVRVAYRFTWSFPSTANDNNYQGASTKADLNWEIS